MVRIPKGGCLIQRQIALATGRKIVRIVVREVINDLGSPFHEGQKIHDLISPALARGEEVEVDFEGMQFISGLFLCGAIAHLLKDHPLERVKRLLHVRNLSEQDRRDLDVIVERSNLYVANPGYREAMDRFVAEHFEVE
jgi:hypothetical protein